MMALLLRLAFLAVGLGCLLGCWAAVRRYRRRGGNLSRLNASAAVLWCLFAGVGAGLITAGVIA